jgi:DNA-binding NarL/FixJ family response regulator
VVADGHALDRRALASLLREQPDFEVVGEAAGATEAVARCVTLQPAVLVLALDLPAEDADGGALSAIRAALPRLRILALSERGAADCQVLNPPSRGRRAGARDRTSFSGGTDCLQIAAARGALGTLHRDAEPEALFAALRAVAAGRAAHEPSVVPPHGAEAFERLSDRERDVALLLAEGCSNKEIGARLAITEPTVKKHIGHILRKLELQDRLQAGLFVARHPLLFTRAHRAAD